MLKKCLLSSLFLFLTGVQVLVSGDQSLLTSIFEFEENHKILRAAWLDPLSHHSIIITKEFRDDSVSQVFRSNDFGKTYQNITDTFSVNGIYYNVEDITVNSNHYNYVILSDSENGVAYFSKDFGQHFHTVNLSFFPKHFTICDSNPDVLVSFTRYANIYYSNDFGRSWEHIIGDTATYISNLEAQELTIYGMRQSYGNSLHSVFYTKFDINKIDYDNIVWLFRNITEIQESDHVVFATQLSPNGLYKLLINPTLNETAMVTALFTLDDDSEFTESHLRHYYVVDAIKDAYILIAVRHNVSNTCDLYRARYDFLDYTYHSHLRFHLVLKNVFCHFPQHTWLQDDLDHMKTFVDIHKVEGMLGTYIATTVQNPTENKTKLNDHNLVSLITWDFGGNWFLISAPERANSGFYTNCYTKNGCSLHLSQNYGLINQYAETSRILTHESAPGLIIATGSLGHGLTSHSDGVFISRNGGVTWHHLFFGRHIYNFGDSGGALIVVPLSPQTPGLFYYSIDLGHSWKNETIKHNNTNIRISILHTHSNKRSLYFNIVAAVEKAKQSLLITINVTKAFEDANQGTPKYCELPPIPNDNDFNIYSSDTNKTYKDFNIWIVPDKHPEQDVDYNIHKSYLPLVGDEGQISTCLLGYKHIYALRLDSSLCIVNDYNMALSRKATFFENTHYRVQCLCSVQDYECNSGFKPNHSLKTCEPIDPKFREMEMLTQCRPKNPNDTDAFYTPGYMTKSPLQIIYKDACIYNFDLDVDDFNWWLHCPNTTDLNSLVNNKYMYISKLNEILRIDYVDSDKPIVTRVHVIDYRKPVAIDASVKDNCLFWVDSEMDVIGSSCYEKTKILLHTGLWSVENIVYDWVSKLLYFSSGREQFIDTIQTQYHYAKVLSHQQTRKRILGPNVLNTPRSLALDPEAGYLFWTDWNTENVYIGRSNLDGSNYRKLVTSPDVFQPNGIAVDYGQRRIIWVDAKLEQIVSCDYECNFASRKIISGAFNNFKKPFGITVIDRKIYFTDWHEQKLISFTNGLTLNNSTITDMKIILNNTGDVLDFKGFKDEMKTLETRDSCQNTNCTMMCVNLPDDKYTCMCPDGFYLVGDKCLCPDKKTEPYDNGTCPISACKNDTDDSFTCKKDDVCIPKSWTCNGYQECSDGSDEKNCDILNKMRALQCNHNSKLIIGSYRCDNVTQCPGGVEHLFCDAPSNCTDTEFQCYTGFGSVQCVNISKRCDGVDDCLDASDEVNCNQRNQTVVDNCKSKNLYSCNDIGGNCFSRNEMCDRTEQCTNGLDEENCIYCDTETEFECNSNLCIPKSQRCDGTPQCADETDELNCVYIITTTTVSNNSSISGKCASNEEPCNDGQCISASFFCDGNTDCKDKSDELNCPSTTTTTTTTTTTAATPEPEVDCDGQFKCKDENRCIPRITRCDNEINCLDGSDEQNCDSYGFSADDYHIYAYSWRPTNLYVNWYKINDPANDTLSLMPVIKKVSNAFRPGPWQNQTDWIKTASSDTYNYIEFSNLEPDTQYNVSMKFWLHKANKIVMLRNEYLLHTESDNHETKSWFQLTVKNYPNHVTLSWVPPLYSAKNIISYDISYHIDYEEAQFQSKIHIDNPMQTQLELPHIYFHPGTWWYFFRIEAKTMQSNEMISSPTVLQKIHFDQTNYTLNVTILNVEDRTVTLHWSAEDNFNDTLSATLNIVDNSDDRFMRKIRTNVKLNSTIVVVDDLDPGLHYVMYVNIIVNGSIAASKHVLVKTTGIPIPKITNATVTTNIITRKAHFMWHKPEDNQGQDEQTWIYGIYLAQNTHELYTKPPKLNTTNLEAVIENIEWCNNYFWSIRVIGPNGKGPMMDPLPILKLHINPIDPPKKVEVTIYMYVSTKMYIHWTPSCYDYLETPKYITNVKNLNTSETYTVSRSDYYNSLSVDICLGNVYEVKTRTYAAINGTQSTFSTPLIVNAPKLHLPTNLTYEERNGTEIYLSWNHNSSEISLRTNDRIIFVIEILNPGRTPLHYRTIRKNITISKESLKTISLDEFTYRITVTTVNCNSTLEWVVYSRIQGNNDFSNHSNNYHSIRSLILPVIAIIISILIVGLLILKKGSINQWVSKRKHNLAYFPRVEQWQNHVHQPNFITSFTSNGNLNNNNNNNVEGNRNGNDIVKNESDFTLALESTNDNSEIAVPDKNQLLD